MTSNKIYLVVLETLDEPTGKPQITKWENEELAKNVANKHNEMFDNLKAIVCEYDPDEPICGSEDYKFFMEEMEEDEELE
jgi:hypothetical protein